MIDLAKIPHALVKPNSFLQRVALFELISPSDYWCACGDHGDSSKESHDFPTFTYQGKAKGNRIVRGRAYSGKPEKWRQEYEYDVYEFSRPPIRGSSG
jgi:hypothetical protein